MTTGGTRVAMLLGIAFALLLPKRVECGYPGATCGRLGAFHELCRGYQVEPWGFYLLESALGRDVGFAYETGEDCR